MFYFILQYVAKNSSYRFQDYSFKGRKAIVKENGFSSYHGVNYDFNVTYLKKMKIQYYLTIAIYAAAPISHAAGFDCSKAHTLVEETICADSELSSLDDDLNEQYDFAIGHNNESTGSRIKREQKAWLLNVRNKCQTSTCLKRVYKKRVTELSNSYSWE